MAYNEINDRVLFASSTLVFVFCEVFWITTEDVENLSPVVVSGRHLAVCIVVAFATGPFQTLDLVALGVFDQAKIGVGIAPGALVVDSKLLNALLEPVLKMKFLVGGTLQLNEFTRMNSKDALLKDIKTRSGWIGVTRLFKFLTLYPARKLAEVIPAVSGKLGCNWGLAPVLGWVNPCRASERSAFSPILIVSLNGSKGLFVLSLDSVSRYFRKSGCF